MVKGLLFKGNWIVVLPSLRNKMSSSILTGHQGVAKGRARAREAVRWPSIGLQIEDFVRRCPICQGQCKPTTAPLLQTPFPQQPWQVVGIVLDEESYLVVVDYFSRFFLVGQTENYHRRRRHCTSNCARFGVPDVIKSDNEPQFSSGEFRAFVTDWGISHTTRSPYYLQSNGAAERTFRQGNNS